MFTLHEDDNSSSCPVCRSVPTPRSSLLNFSLQKHAITMGNRFIGPHTAPVPFAPSGDNVFWVAWFDISFVVLAMVALLFIVCPKPLARNMPLSSHRLELDEASVRRGLMNRRMAGQTPEPSEGGDVESETLLFPARPCAQYHPRRTVSLRYRSATAEDSRSSPMLSTAAGALGRVAAMPVPSISQVGRLDEGSAIVYR